MGRYKKGESGNPKGRPPKPKSERIDIRAMLEEALNGKLILRIGNKEEQTTYIKAGLKQLAQQFAKGDAKARRDVFWLAEKYGLNLVESLDENDGDPLAAGPREPRPASLWSCSAFTRTIWLAI
jgi:hypothetical protein